MCCAFFVASKKRKREHSAGVKNWPNTWQSHRGDLGQIVRRGDNLSPVVPKAPSVLLCSEGGEKLRHSMRTRFDLQTNCPNHKEFPLTIIFGGDPHVNFVDGKINKMRSCYSIVQYWSDMNKEVECYLCDIAVCFRNKKWYFFKDQFLPTMKCTKHKLFNI